MHFFHSGILIVKHIPRYANFVKGAKLGKDITPWRYSNAMNRCEKLSSHNKNIQPILVPVISRYIMLLIFLSILIFAMPTFSNATDSILALDWKPVNSFDQSINRIVMDDTKTIYAIGYSNLCTMYDISGKQIATLALPEQRPNFKQENSASAEKINDIAVSPNGKYLVLSSTGAIRIYTMADKSYVDMPCDSSDSSSGAPIVAASNNFIYAVINNSLERKAYTEKIWTPITVAPNVTTHLQVSKNDGYLFVSHQITMGTFELKRLNFNTGVWADDKLLPAEPGDDICKSFIVSKNDVLTIGQYYDSEANFSYPQLASKVGNKLILAEQLGGGEGFVTLQPFDVENTPICLDVAQNSVGDAALISSYLAGSGHYIDLQIADSGKPPVDEGLLSETGKTSEAEKPQASKTKKSKSSPPKPNILPRTAIILLVAAIAVFIGLFIGLRLRKMRNSLGLVTSVDKENISISQDTAIRKEKDSPRLNTDSPDVHDTKPSALYCKNCGMVALPGASFCNKCGQPLNKGL